MRFDWELVHIIGVNPYGGNLEQLRGGLPIGDERTIVAWDFPHLHDAIKALLQDNDDRDVYIYGSVQSAYDSGRRGAQIADKAPVMHIITLPSGRIPTQIVASKSIGDDDDVYEEDFYAFRDLHLSWVRVEHPDFAGRGVYRLDCNSVPDDEQAGVVHEGTSLYLLTSRDTERDAEGEFNVESVPFEYCDENGNMIMTRWNQSQHRPLQDCFDELVRDDFANSAPEEQVRARRRIEEAAQTEIQEIRRRKHSYLQDLGCEVTDLKLFSALPANYPAAITGLWEDRYFRRFAVQQQQGEVVCFSDHSLRSTLRPNGGGVGGGGGEYVHQVDERVLARLNTSFDESSPTAILFSVLMADFLFATGCHENLSGRGMRGFKNNVISNMIFEIFGVDRVLQFLGQNTKAFDYIQRKPTLIRTVQMICRNLGEAFNRRPGDLPTSASDFFLRFLWQDHPSILHSANYRGRSVDRIRFRSNYGQDRIQNGLASLEVKFRGRGANFVSISMGDLEQVYRGGGIEDQLLKLLVDPTLNNKGLVGAYGARHDDDYDDQSTRDCLPAALKAAPDVLLSPTGKLRVGIVFRKKTEVSITHFRSELSSRVKTLRMKEIKSNQHHHAMHSNEVMVGVFDVAPQKHCVLIDGRSGRDATITDPALNKTVPRTNRSLKKLGINHFRHLFVLQRVEMSTQRRYQSQKKLGLPFLPSLSDNDSKSAP